MTRNPIAKAVRQLRPKVKPDGRRKLLDAQEREEMLREWGEYRAQGGKLDFTAWQEKQEREADQPARIRF